MGTHSQQQQCQRNRNQDGDQTQTPTFGQNPLQLALFQRQNCHVYVHREGHNGKSSRTLATHTEEMHSTNKHTQTSRFDDDKTRQSPPTIPITFYMLFGTVQCVFIRVKGKKKDIMEAARIGNTLI